MSDNTLQNFEARLKIALQEQLTKNKINKKNDFGVLSQLTTLKPFELR